MSLPLAGFRVVDLTAVVSGPMATAVLADQGADVIKVEPLPAGDLTRILGSARGGVTSLFETINRGKRSLALDLKQAAGRELLLALVPSADLVVENFRPGAMARLGLGYEELRRVRADLVYVSITGFGPDGPYAGNRVYDAIVQAVSGIAAVQANPERQVPELVRNLICDKVTALTAAQAMTAALLLRQRTGAGSQVSLSMLDASVAFLWPDGFANEMFLPDHNAPELETTPRTHDTYRPLPTRDGAVTLMVVSDSDFAATCRALNRPDLIADPRFATVRIRRQHSGEMVGLLAAEIARFDTATVVRRMAEEDAPCARVNRRDEVRHDPQVRHNRIVVEVEHPRAGKIALARPAAVFGGQPSAPRDSAPLLGEHTREILAELGVGAERVRSLLEHKTIQLADGAPT